MGGELLDAIGALDPDGAREAWERWPGEPDGAFAGFVAYRDLGRGRSVREAARKVGRQPGNVYKESSAWGWQERARKWDDEQDRRFAAEMLDARVAMGRQHLTIANALLGKGVEALRELDPRKLSARELREYIESAVRLARLVAGDVTDRVESSGVLSLEVDPGAARAELEAVQGEIARRLAVESAAAPVE
jgi:hypothetical protein